MPGLKKKEKGQNNLCRKEVNPASLISDEFWEKIVPLLPPPKKKKKTGRPRMDDRQAMNAILYLLYTGIQWKFLPRYFGAKSTVHDRF